MVSKTGELKGKVCLLDADLVAHKAACVAEKTEYLVTRSISRETVTEWTLLKHYDNAKEAKILANEEDGEVWKRTVDKGKDLALEAVQSMIMAIQSKTEYGSLLPVLSGKGNFRYKIAKTVPYKSTREVIGKPKYLRACREYIQNQYDTLITDGIEADDWISCEATKRGEQVFVCSIDKDLDQIVGYHFNWVRDTVYRVSEKEAAFNLYTQIIAGDSTDDVPGLLGAGPKFAEGLLKGATSNKDLFARTWRAYRDRDCLDSKHIAGRWRYFEEQSRLVYLLRKMTDTFEHLPGYTSFEELQT